MKITPGDPRRSAGPAKPGTDSGAGRTRAARSSAVGPVDVADYERLAPAHMSAMAWDYLSGGAEDELTLRWNHEAYGHIRLRPRNLVDVSQLDTRVTLFGRELPFPILLAPTGYQRLFHPGGELAVVKGAAAAKATLVVSTAATTSVEAIAAVATCPLWFQLYVQPDRGFTRELVQRAEAAGCQALVVTVDTPVLGPRYRERRSKFNLPPEMERENLKGLPAAKGGHRPTEHSIYSPLQDAKLAWTDIDWLRSLTRLPVLFKGMMNADDAAQAVDAGVSGLIVSNHGGRNLDTQPATIDALPGVVAKVAGRAPVLVDGGIRRGTDILKALAFGATAVLIGRPYLYGLAVGGAEGVTHVVNILRREFEIAMALTGRPSIATIDDSVIWK
ncbi:MAG: alpha-hydroxy-acid oxidizing protein [Opitutaceae bacterium]|nr:alpha-hydroxy-acid oxidizing protein [Opitutaceae bacterium]